MKKAILLTSIAIVTLVACSKDDDTWEYGDEQALMDSEWVNVSLGYVTSETFSPIRSPKEQTIRFEGNGNFTMTTQGNVYDEERHLMRDTTILTHGNYQYEHPTLRMTPEAGSPTVEAWISPLNRICFHDNGDLREFKRK
jgi:hypothetical protein